jgi:hypothetical protein
MPAKKGERPLKVCYTCRYWSYQFKGLCERLGQGVGKFWICEDWCERSDRWPADPETPNPAGAPRRS